MMAKRGAGELRCHLIQRRRVLEADREDGVVAAAGEVAQRFRAFGIGLRLPFLEIDPGIGPELHRSVVDAGIERLVPLAAQVVDDTGADIGGADGDRGQNHQGRGEALAFHAHACSHASVRRLAARA